MSSLFTKLRAKLSEARETHEYRKESVILDFTEDLIARMDDLKLSRSELARKLDVSPAYVTQILRGSANFTLDSMVKIANAVGCELSTHLTPCDREAIWIEVASNAGSSGSTSNEHDSLQTTAAANHDELSIAA